MLDKGRSLDKVAARLIVDGLIAYGWTYSELKGIRAKLLDQLRLYIDLSELALEQGTEEALPSHDGLTSPAALTSMNNSVDEGVASSEQWGCYYNDSLFHG